MATTTPNLGLRKPGTADAVNVTTDIDGNMDLIDTAFASLAPSAGVVHIAGVETITGAKTFSANVTLTNVDIVLNATTGTKVGTATTQKLGFYNAAPVVQPAGTVDVLASLVTLGLRAASSNPPLNLGTGALTAGASSLGATTTTTLGTGTVTMSDATNIVLGTVTGTKIGTATAQKIGFFNATPVVQPTSTTDLKASLVNLGLIAGAGATPLDLNGGALTVATIGTGTVTMTDATNIVVGTTTGTKIGTATTQKLGFYNATPVVQEAGANDVLASLVTLGLRAASANPPLNLGTGTVTCGSVNCGTVTMTDATNIAVGTTTGTKIGTATTQKLGFYNAAPVVQTTGATDVLAGLVTIGLRAASANPPLNLGSGALTAGASALGATTVTTLGTGGNVTLADGNNIAAGTTTGTQIGTATTQKLGFFAATPVVQQTGASDVLASLVTLGLRAASANPPLNLGSGALTAGATTTTTLGCTTLTITDANNIVVGTTTGTKIGTATTQKLGFFNATPVVQEAGANDVLASLVTLGLRAASANPPLNLGSGALTAGASTLGATTTTTLGCTTVTITDANNIVLGTTTGTKIGTATTQKLAFYNSAPVVKPTAYTQTYSTASKTHNTATAVGVAVTGATSTTPFGYTTAAQANAIVTAVNALESDLDNVKQVLNALVDDLQALGLVG